MDWKAVLRSIHRSNDPVATLYALILPDNNFCQLIKSYIPKIVVDELTPSDLVQDICIMADSAESESQIVAKAHFAYIATSISHLFRVNRELCRKSTILTYKKPNVPAPYIWFNLDEEDDQYAQLIKHILPTDGYFRLQITVDNFTQKNSYVLSSGIRMKCVRGETFDIIIKFESKTVVITKGHPNFPGCVILFTIKGLVMGLFINHGESVEKLPYVLH